MISRTTSPRRMAVDSVTTSLPFAELGEVEWQAHGLEMRSGIYLNHGSERYWVVYCPFNGITRLNVLIRPRESRVVAARVYYFEACSCEQSTRGHTFADALARFSTRDDSAVQ